MKCERAIKLLPFLHDGSLAPEIAREASEHVAQCERCRTERARLSHTLSLVRQYLGERAPLALPPTFHETVMKKIRKRKQERTVASWAVPVAASLFLVASIASYTLFNDDYEFGRQMARPPANEIYQTDPNHLEERAIITTMYHYADVSVYDVLRNMDDLDEWEIEIGFGEVIGE